jgi:hypothetical protein
MIPLLYHNKLYNNHMTKSFFIQVIIFLTFIRVQKNDIVMSKNGHSSLQTPK